MKQHSDELLLEVVTLAQKAGEAIMGLYRHPQGISVTSKEDQSPLTQADLQADFILKQGLNAIADYPYLSEESQYIPFEERAVWETYWLVDPLDGTKEFLKRTNEFTVNVALVHQGQLVLGVVHAPALGVTYFGSLQKGSYRQYTSQIAEKLPLSERKSGKLKIVVSRSHANPEEMEMVSNLITIPSKKMMTVSIGSSLKFCLLAEGSAQLYPRSGPTYEWDTAAGHAILNFTGGDVIDTVTNSSLSYNKKSLLNNPFIATAFTQKVTPSCQSLSS